MKWHKLLRSAEFWAGVIVIVGLLIRIHQISPALLERTVNRQILDATLARGLYERGLDKLGMFLYGFPLYHWLVAGGYKLLGTTNEVTGRVISVAASVLAAYWLFKLVSLKKSKWLATISLFFFYVASPVNIIMGRSFLVDEITLAFNLGGIYYFSLWRKTRQEAAFFGGCVLFSLMMLSKITFGYVLLPALFLMGKPSKRWLFLGLIVLLPTIGWYVYGKNINQQLAIAPTGWNVWWWFSPGQLLNLRFYINGFVFMSTWATTPIGFVLSLIGLTLRESWRKQKLFYIWLLAGILFLLVFNRASISHNYYYLAVVVPMAVLASQATLKLIKPINKWQGILLGAVIMLTMINPEFLRAYRVYPPYKQIPLAAERIKEISYSYETIAISAYNTQALGYFSTRKYYDLWLGSLTDAEAKEKLEEYQQMGAKYYVVYSLEELRQKPIFSDYLKHFPKIIDYEWLFVYDLR